MLVGYGQDRARIQPDIGIDGVRKYADRRCLAPPGPRDQGRGHAVAGNYRQGPGGNMLEGRIGFLVPLRQRQPGLQPQQRRIRLPLFVGRALRMGDAATGRHPVDLTGPDGLHRADAVAMHDLALDQPGQGGETDMRVRPDIQPPARRQHGRAEMIEKHERPDHAALARRQGAPHLEIADILRPRHDDGFHVGTRLGRSAFGLFRFLPRHWT